MGKLQPLNTRDTGFGAVFGGTTSSGYEKPRLKYKAGEWILILNLWPKQEEMHPPFPWMKTPFGWQIVTYPGILSIVLEYNFIITVSFRQPNVTIYEAVIWSMVYKYLIASKYWNCHWNWNCHWSGLYGIVTEIKVCSVLKATTLQGLMMHDCILGRQGRNSAVNGNWIWCLIW